MPAYAGLLGSTGLAFLLDTAVLLPVTVATLLLAVGALGFQAARRRGFGPFAVGLIAAVLLLSGKFAVDSVPLTQGGVTLLIAASVWNSWPIRRSNNHLIQLEIEKPEPLRGGLNHEREAPS